jgi:hypothetical protein
LCLVGFSSSPYVSCIDRWTSSYWPYIDEKKYPANWSSLLLDNDCTRLQWSHCNTNDRRENISKSKRYTSTCTQWIYRIALARACHMKLAVSHREILWHSNAWKNISITQRCLLICIRARVVSLSSKEFFWRTRLTLHYDE